ncbi:MAG: malonate transporter subunit MadL [Lautropia sp.]|nr:malonate transporter subunit MadL [Lautropia sp.]
MTIYGTALLAACVLAGLFIGNVLGVILGVKANVGGVGFAMIFLILASDHLRNRGMLPEPTQEGISFWSSIYIPVVVAMAAQQNVVGALKGGPAAILAGVLSSVVCYALIPVVVRMGAKQAVSGESD